MRPGRMYRCGPDVVLVLAIRSALAGIPDSDCVDVFVLYLNNSRGPLARWFVYRSNWIEVGR